MRLALACTTNVQNNTNCFCFGQRKSDIELDRFATMTVDKGESVNVNAVVLTLSSRRSNHKKGVTESFTNKYEYERGKLAAVLSVCDDGDD
jgi:hypothetical protein